MINYPLSSHWSINSSFKSFFFFFYLIKTATVKRALSPSQQKTHNYLYIKYFTKKHGQLEKKIPNLVLKCVMIIRILLS